MHAIAPTATAGASFAWPLPACRTRRAARGMRAGADGRAAEAETARRYRLAGWEVLAQNWRAERAYGGGEIDIVARRGDVLAFVEVKSRHSVDEAAAALTPAQRRRIEAAALRFAEVTGTEACEMRFDLSACGRDGGVRILQNISFD